MCRDPRRIQEYDYDKDNELSDALTEVERLKAENEKLKEAIIKAIKHYPTMYYAEYRTQDVFYKSLYRLEYALKMAKGE